MTSDNKHLLMCVGLFAISPLWAMPIAFLSLLVSGLFYDVADPMARYITTVGQCQGFVVGWYAFGRWPS